MRAAIVALALVAGCHAPKWSAGDTFVESGVALTLGADYLQTRQICGELAAGTAPDWVYETNPIMGRTCDRVPPPIYFSAALAAHVGAARLLPGWARRLFQFATIAYQLKAIDRNLAAGYSITF